MPDRALEAFDRLGFAFGDGFDAAVRQIAHRSVYAFARGGNLRKPPEADALHASAHAISPRDSHRAPDYSGGGGELVAVASTFSGSALIGSSFWRCSS
jgi:hypothetical protein